MHYIIKQFNFSSVYLYSSNSHGISSHFTKKLCSIQSYIHSKRFYLNSPSSSVYYSNWLKKISIKGNLADFIEPLACSGNLEEKLPVKKPPAGPEPGRVHERQKTDKIRDTEECFLCSEKE